VHHPNAVQFLGACTKQEPYILVTELMPGGSMADTFRMMKVSSSEVLLLVKCRLVMSLQLRRVQDT
jgi:serine/threonine protein kinase